MLVHRPTPSLPPWLSADCIQDPWDNVSDRPNEDREAGQTFEKAAKIEIENLKEPDEAANTYLDAFKVYRNDSPDDAVRCADFTINRWCSKGNFRRAATQKETLGDMFENQVDNLALAQDAYEAAAGWYEGDGAAAYVWKTQSPNTQRICD